MKINVQKLTKYSDCGKFLAFMGKKNLLILVPKKIINWYFWKSWRHGPDRAVDHELYLQILISELYFEIFIFVFILICIRIWTKQLYINYKWYFINHETARVSQHMNCAYNSSFMNCAMKSAIVLYAHPHLQAYLDVADKYKLLVVFYLSQNTCVSWHELRMKIIIYELCLQILN